MNDASPVVIKAGGSLLDWPELPERLQAYLDLRASERVVLVVGGGAAADLIRRMDQIHSLGEERSHVLALRSLDLTAHLLASLLENVVVVDRLEDLKSCWNSAKVPAFAPRHFLETEEAGPDPLPRSWGLTTDSVAARLALRLDARELVLLKSADPPACLTEAVASGYIDGEFLKAAVGVRRIVARNLRSPTANERIWEASRDPDDL